MRRILKLCGAVLGAILISSPAPGAQALSPYSGFQGLSSQQLATVQGKITNVGASPKQMYTLAFSSSGQAIDLSVFRPFYRDGYDYVGDFSSPQTFAVSTGEIESIIDSIATLPTVTDGDVDADGHLSFALSVVKGGTTEVFESIVNATDGRLLFGRLLGALQSNAAGTDQVTSLACRLSLLPGATASDVIGVVSIRLRGFRKDRSTGQYVGSVRVTNTGGQSIAGPMIIAFRPPEGVTLSSAAGYTCAVWPHGAPYLSLPVGTALAAGQHVDVVLRFDNPDDSPIVLMGQKVYAGSGFR